MKVFFRNKQLFLLGFIIFLIILTTSIIFLINNNSLNNFSDVGSDLKGYTALKQKLNSLKPDIDSRYQDAISQFNIVENKSLSKQDRYNALAKSSVLLTDSYLRTKNPNVYSFVKNDLTKFALDNFKSYYINKDFKIPCQDTSCAQSSIPNEISTVINEINSAKNLPADSKQMMVENLQTASYMSNDNPKNKATSFLSISYAIRNDKTYMDAGLSSKLADEIEAFVKAKYSKYYRVYTP